MAEAGDKKLYVVHVGFYDQETNFGVYESHTNFFVAAADPREAKSIVKEMPVYRAKKMHTDGIQEIQMVQGFRIKLEKDATNADKDIVRSISYDEINPSTPISNTN